MGDGQNLRVERHRWSRYWCDTSIFIVKTLDRRWRRKCIRPLSVRESSKQQKTGPRAAEPGASRVRECGAMRCPLPRWRPPAAKLAIPERGSNAVWRLASQVEATRSVERTARVRLQVDLNAHLWRAFVGAHTAPAWPCHDPPKVTT